MQIAAAVSRDVWPRMGGAQYPPDGKGHPTCTIRRNTLAGIIYCCTNGVTPRRRRVPPRVPARSAPLRFVLRLSLLDFRAAPATHGVSSTSSFLPGRRSMCKISVWGIRDLIRHTESNQRICQYVLLSKFFGVESHSKELVLKKSHSIFNL